MLASAVLSLYLADLWPSDSTVKLCGHKFGSLESTESSHGSEESQCLSEGSLKVLSHCIAKVFFFFLEFKIGFLGTDRTGFLMSVWGGIYFGEKW